MINREEIEKKATLYASSFKGASEVHSLIKDAFTAGFYHGQAEATEIPKTLREMRLKLNLSLKEVAEACGTNLYYLPQIENVSRRGQTYKKVHEYLSKKLKEQSI